MRVGRGSGGRRLVARIVVGLGQVGWNAERVAAPRAFVIHRLFIAQQLVDIAAARQQCQGHQCRRSGMTFVHTHPHDI
ncbi:Uncharacterised protein [Bordetella pertussis]|nr:Uncharacterised protein [Bordetella pertussis]